MLCTLFLCFLILLTKLWLEGFWYLNTEKKNNAIDFSDNSGEADCILATESLLTEKDAASTINDAKDSVMWEEQLSTLQAEYKNVVGWLQSADESISYPVMFSGDNTYYLEHAYDDTESRAGSLFLDAACSGDWSAPLSIIHGHNMKDLSMFGSLKFYKTDTDFLQKNPYFKLFTESGEYVYRVFAFCDVAEDDILYSFEERPIVSAMRLQVASYVDCRVPIRNDDKFLFLSTCSSEGKHFIVCTVLKK